MHRSFRKNFKDEKRLYFLITRLRKLKERKLLVCFLNALNDIQGNLESLIKYIKKY